MDPERAHNTHAPGTAGAGDQQAQADAIDAAVAQAVAACDGDLAAAIRALVIANTFLTEQNAALSRELDYAWRWISPGFTRSTRKRRMKSGDP
jgi:hypothetical protein